MIRFAFSLALSLVSVGVAPTSFASSNDKIDQLFPYYTMECSLTQGQPVGQKAYGSLGHALIYIKGACRDTSVNYPKVKVCDEGTDLTSPNSGVAMSADKALKNTRFLAVDGKDMMLNGALNPGDPVDAAAIAKTRDAIVASGALNNVQVHDQYLKAKDKSASDRSLSNEQYIAKIGADTDYAVLFARNLRCAWIPMNRAQIQAEVDKANELNADFVSGRAVNDWNGLAKNCANFTHNVLAAAGIRKNEFESHNLFVQAFNFLTLRFMVPANETLKSTIASHDMSKIRSAEEIYNDKNDTSYNDFMAFGTLPQSGGLFNRLAMRAEGNTEYVEKDAATMLDVPLLKPRAKQLARLAVDPAFQDIATSITAVRDQMVDVQSSRITIADDASSDFKDFAVKYNRWIDDSIIDLNAKLSALAQ